MTDLRNLYGTFASLVPTTQPTPAQHLHAFSHHYCADRSLLLRGIYPVNRVAPLVHAHPWSPSANGHICAASSAHHCHSDGHPSAHEDAHPDGHAAAHPDASGNAVSNTYPVAHGYPAAHAQRDAHPDGDPVANSCATDTDAGAGFPNAYRDASSPHTNTGAHLYTAASHSDPHIGAHPGGYPDRNAHACTAIPHANAYNATADSHANGCSTHAFTRGYSHALGLTERSGRPFFPGNSDRESTPHFAMAGASATGDVLAARQGALLRRRARRARG